MTDLPDGIDTFLAQNGWEEAAIEALPGDASFRRYFRIAKRGRRAMLMHAPPPHEDPGPFLHVAQWLATNGLRAPDIYGQNLREGWVLIEDFGDDRVRERIEQAPQEEHSIYAAAVDTLVALHRLEPGPFSPYDLPTYLREAELFTQWYCPAVGLDVDAAAYRDAWEEALAPLIARQGRGVTVLRDYHAENIMLPPDGTQGLIDFQDALVGHPAYDLVSLLQDARRDVSRELEGEMLDRYVAASGAGRHFAADYACLGAQRNAKIVGIFTRLHRRDDKPRYLAMIPRVWEALERDLADPALRPVAAWFEANIPRALRDARGGDIA